MKQPQEISALIAFSAGVLSFVSPCVLPLIPSYISYITGISFKKLTDADAKSKLRWATVSHSILFILGFSTVFVLMGASASYLGQLFVHYQYWIMKAGGVLIIILGIHFIGVFKLSFLEGNKRFELKNKPLGYVGSFFVGIIFAAGWTPCIGPILSTILIYAGASSDFNTGILLLGVYSLGLGLPFFLCSLAFNSFLSAFDKIKRGMRIVTIVSGFFMIAIGLLLVTNTFKEISGILNLFGEP